MAELRTICELNGQLVSASVEGQQISLPRGAPMGAMHYPEIKLNPDPVSWRPDPHQGPLSNGGPAGYEDGSKLTSIRSFAAETWGEVANIWATRASFLYPSSWRQKDPGQIEQDSRHSGQQRLAWHPQQQQVAAANGPSIVEVYHLEAGRVGHQAAGPRPPAPAIHLQHPQQTQVSALAYRPHRRSVLAVAGHAAVCLWEFSQSNASSPALNCRVLRTQSRTQLSRLAWSPDGRLLAASHADSSGFTVWDVALGNPTKLSTGLSSTDVLSWSPNGSYLLVSSPRGGFHIWETENWSNAAWQMPADGHVVSACWSSDSKSLLLAYSNSPQLAAVYFIGQPPSLQAQILPIDLPEFPKLSEQGSLILSLDWDPTMERLAISTSSTATTSGQTFLYATSTRPVIKANLLGLIDLGARTAQCLSFHRSYRQGALLAACTGQREIFVLPLMFTPQSGA